MVLLSSDKAAAMEGESSVINPETKKLCSDASAAELMGPVDSGERRMAKNGARS